MNYSTLLLLRDSCVRCEMVVCPAVNCNAVLLSVCLALDYFSVAASVSISILCRCNWQFLYSSQDWPVPWSPAIAFIPLTYLAVCALKVSKTTGIGLENAGFEQIPRCMQCDWSKYAVCTRHGHSTIANELLFNSTSMQQQCNAKINERSHVFYN